MGAKVKDVSATGYQNRRTGDAARTREVLLQHRDKVVHEVVGPSIRVEYAGRPSTRSSFLDGIVDEEWVDAAGRRSFELS